VSVKFKDVDNTEDALKSIVQLMIKGSTDETIRETAIKLTQGTCDSRDDLCEVTMVFEAVKHGDSRVPALRNGIRYLADPRYTDWYQAAPKTLQLGAGDCDDQTILVGALLISLGFIVGARAWGKKPGDYTHVYPTVALPKNLGKGESYPENYFGTGLDTTVPQSDVGWEPRGGYILTAWPKE
jgi:hypothetical protein